MTWPETPDWPTVENTERTADAARLVLSVPADSPWLQGHFPERAVLPGVVQLRWAIQAAGRLWPELGTVAGVANLKFQNPVLPPARLTLILDVKRDPAPGKLSFRFEQDDRVSARGVVRFA